MVRSPLLIVSFLTVISPAFANGGMALVYGTFQWNFWLLYVAITVLFEAFTLGRWANVGFSRALAVSVGANVVTGLVGALFSGIFGYIVYGIGAKSYVEPNPLGHAVFRLVVGGVISAFLESIFWTREAGNSALRASLLVHLAGVPLALILLLIPARPYEGLEGQANFRRHSVREKVAIRLDIAIHESESKPFLAPKNWDELLQRVSSVMEVQQSHSPEALRVSGFQPNFSRFDTGETFREPAEFNPGLIGKDLRNLEKADWLVRWGRGRWQDGIAIDSDGNAKYTGNIEKWLQQYRR